MCYSAMIRAEYKQYVKDYGAVLSIHEYVEKHWEKIGDDWVRKLAAPFREWFKLPGTPETQWVRDRIEEWTGREIGLVEAELTKQQERLALNSAKLATKVTKTAQNEVRIATDKVAAATATLERLRNPRGSAERSRIFPQSLAPVMIWDNGRRVVKMMRFMCRPAGKPSASDWVFNKETGRKTVSGTYNARRDNLERFWRKQFGYTHGVVIADSFFEHVARHDLEGRALRPGERFEDVILEFNPNNGKPLHIACLWSHWTGPGAGEPDQPDLESFAFITDEPPAEVAAAGHDRCVIPIRPENIDAWLNPDPSDLASLYAILDDRERPYYEHQIAEAA